VLTGLDTETLRAQFGVQELTRIRGDRREPCILVPRYLMATGNTPLPSAEQSRCERTGADFRPLPSVAYG
jgi:hypothetical protein